MDPAVDGELRSLGSNERHEAGLRRLGLGGMGPDPAVETAATEGTKPAYAGWNKWVLEKNTRVFR